MKDPREHWAVAAEAFAARRGADPAWLQALRKEGLASFAATGFPTTRQEAWRYTNVSRVVKPAFELADGARRAGAAGPPSRAALEAIAFPVYACSLFVFVDGRFAPQLSSPRALSGSLQVESLAEVWARDPARLEPHLGRLAPPDATPFAALGAALLADGALLEIPDGMRVEAPVHVVHVASPGAAPLATHPRTLVVAGRGCEATLIEDHVTLGEGAFLTNAVTELVLRDGARLDVVKLQREALSGSHVSYLAARLGRDAGLTAHTLTLGGGLTRNDASVVLDGEGAECTLDGLYVGSGEQHVDNHTRIEHARPRGSSRELYKGILDDRARGIFHGLVVVREGAVKTDARQTNKNLLLSRQAEANSQPQLEISADDVKCSHGSTIGQLDEGSLFYLRARGLGAVEARRLLMRAFAAEVTDRIRQEALRRAIEEIVAQRLHLDAPASGAAA